MELKKIDARVSIAGQITPEELSDIATLGIKTVINNRPDGEARDQPPNEALQAAAAAANLNWYYLPVTMKSMSRQDAKSMHLILNEMPGPVLAFCRSGQRSSLLYLASLLRESSLDEVMELAKISGLHRVGLEDFLRGFKD